MFIRIQFIRIQFIRIQFIRIQFIRIQFISGDYRLQKSLTIHALTTCF